MRRIPEGERSPHHPADVVPLYVSIDAEAVSLAKVRSAGPKKLGEYLGRLIFEDVARQQERARLQQEGMVTG